MFLKEVSDFSYDNSEDLGNAFEYLLSIMGSQGDAGQFRTPRHIIDMMVAGEIAFLVNTPKGHSSRGDGFKMRGEAVSRGIDMATTMSGAVALVQAIAALRQGPLDVYALQDL